MRKQASGETMAAEGPPGDDGAGSANQSPTPSWPMPFPQRDVPRALGHPLPSPCHVWQVLVEGSVEQGTMNFYSMLAVCQILCLRDLISS